MNTLDEYLAHFDELADLMPQKGVKYTDAEIDTFRPATKEIEYYLKEYFTRFGLEYATSFGVHDPQIKLYDVGCSVYNNVYIGPNIQPRARVYIGCSSLILQSNYLGLNKKCITNKIKFRPAHGTIKSKSILTDPVMANEAFYSGMSDYLKQLWRMMFELFDKKTNAYRW